MLLHVGAAQRVLILRRVIIAVLDAHIPGPLLLPDGAVRHRSTLAQGWAPHFLVPAEGVLARGRMQVEDALRHGLAVVAPSEIHPALVVRVVGLEGIHMRVLVVLGELEQPGLLLAAALHHCLFRQQLI